MTMMLSSTRRILITQTRASLLSTGRTAVPQHLVHKRGYHENIVEHYENPRNVGSFDKNDSSVGTVC